MGEKQYELLCFISKGGKVDGEMDGIFEEGEKAKDRVEFLFTFTEEKN